MQTNQSMQTNRQWKRRRRVLAGELLENRALLTASPTTVQPLVFDDYFSVAQNLGQLSGTEQRTDSVGRRDYNDFYRFQIDAGKLQLGLTGLQADVDVRIYNSQYQVVAQSTNSGTRPESLSVDLAGGTYFIRVYAYGWYFSSTYSLTISAGQPAVAPTPPATSPTTPATPDTTPTVTSPTTTPTTTVPAEFPDVAYYGGGNDWSVNAVRAPEVWAQGYTGDGVVVAIVDTGIDLNHPDLDGNLWINADEIPGNGRDDDRNGYVDDVYGWDFASNDSNPDDPNGHGTHVAGIVAAEANGRGATGVAYDATLMPVRVLGTDGSGSLTAVAAGIRYAVDNGADVINLSLGSSFASSVLYAALNYASQHDVLVVAAAGNSGNSRPDYPARYSANLGNVLSVGAYSSSSAVAGFSNRVGSSNAVQIDAPGVSVYSTVANNRYAIYSGTSMASPQAAGVAALALSANPNLTASQLRSILVSGATTSVRSSDARGGVNAARTVASAAALSSSSASASASSSASSVVAIGAANAASSRGTADSIHARLRRLGSSLFSSNTEVASRARSNRVSHNGVTPDRAAYFAAISNDGAHHVQNGSVLAVDALFAAIPMWNRDFG